MKRWELWLTVALAVFIFGLASQMPETQAQAQAMKRFEVGQTYVVVWNCIPSGISALADYMIKTAGGPDDSDTLCREEVLTVTAVGSDGLIEVFDQREKDKLDADGSKQKPGMWVANPAMMQAWHRVVHPAERQASR